MGCGASAQGQKSNVQTLPAGETVSTRIKPVAVPEQTTDASHEKLPSNGVQMHHPPEDITLHGPPAGLDARESIVSEDLDLETIDATSPQTQEPVAQPIVEAPDAPVNPPAADAADTDADDAAAASTNSAEADVVADQEPETPDDVVEVIPPEDPDTSTPVPEAQDEPEQAPAEPAPVPEPAPAFAENSPSVTKSAFKKKGHKRGKSSGGVQFTSKTKKMDAPRRIAKFVRTDSHKQLLADADRLLNGVVPESPSPVDIPSNEKSPSPARLLDAGISVGADASDWSRNHEHDADKFRREEPKKNTFSFNPEAFRKANSDDTAHAYSLSKGGSKKWNSSLIDSRRSNASAANFDLVDQSLMNDILDEFGSVKLTA